MPDCGLSGATTTTLPNSRAIFISALMPGASTPSSFVTKIIGFFIDIVKYC
jgi:hypothetical protein